MDVAPVTSLERILSRRHLIRGHAGIAAFWSIGAAVLLLVLLLHVGLVVDLLVHRGRIELSLPPHEVERFERLTNLHVAGNVAAKTDKAVVPDDATEPNHVFHDELGLLPAVWWSRDAWYGPTIAYLYRHVGWLQSNVLALLWLLTAAALVIIVRYFCLGQIRRLSHRAAIEAVTATRRNLYRQAMRLGPEDLDGTGQETAQQMFFAEVESIRNGLYESATRWIRFPLELIVLSIVLLSLDWRLTLQWIVPLTLGAMLLEGVRRRALQKKLLIADRTREEEHLLRSNLKHARLTRGLGIEQTEQEWFQKHLDRYHARLVELARTADIVVYPQSKVVVTCAALMAFLLFLVFDNVLVFRSYIPAVGMTLAEAVTFLVAMGLLVPGVRALGELKPIRRELTLAADKVRAYLERIPSVSQAVGAKFLQPMAKTLHFENVKYQTPGGRKVLDGIDFKLEVDKSYAVVSIDPLEARAVALMLPRFIEPREGRVMIDGEDIAWVTLESLRAETVFVAADDPPFEGTVFENIRGGQADLTLQQVTEAAKMTHAHNFIVKLFNGYETVLAADSDSLDAGQRFRLGLARAIVRDPALLVIEEPNASFDEDTKALLADAYDRICHERTVIFLPSRMSTVRRTDQVVVLYEGKVVAFAPHAKLVTQSPVYRHWEYVRFNEFRHDV